VPVCRGSVFLSSPHFRSDWYHDWYHETSGSGTGRPATSLSKIGAMAQPRPWPDVGEEGRWAIEQMEELFATTEQDAEGLLARAEQLRAQAAQAEFEEQANVYLALAERYEAVAATRLAAN